MATRDCIRFEVAVVVWGRFVDSFFPPFHSSLLLRALIRWGRGGGRGFLFEQCYCIASSDASNYRCRKAKNDDEEFRVCHWRRSSWCQSTNSIDMKVHGAMGMYMKSRLVSSNLNCGGLNFILEM